MTSAAFFDLDRTLIAGSSAETFAHMLRAVGVALPAPVGSAVYFDLYQRFGDDPVSTRLARFGSQLFAGTPVGKVEAAGRLTADVVASDLLPGAVEAISEHRAASNPLVLVTSNPAPLAEAIAEKIRFDDVLCTRYGSVDGRYDGSTESSHLSGRTKALAVAAWADAHEVDLDASWAYSDSIYDAPLLRLVGHPVAVNPDLRLWLLARATGWPIERWTNRS